MADWDVLIVGGGIAGASLGAAIAGKRRTLIVEAESHCGAHATGRSAAFWQWREVGFGALDPRVVMRDTIPATTLMVGGMEIALAAFLLSVLSLREGN